MKLTDVLKMLNVNGVTYQVVRQPEFGKTYIKATVLSNDLAACMQSILDLSFVLENNYYDLGDGIYLTFEDWVVNEDKTFAQFFLEANADLITNATCLGGNVNVYFEKLPDGIGNVLSHCKKVVGPDYIQYTVKRDKTNLVISTRKR